MIRVVLAGLALVVFTTLALAQSSYYQGRPASGGGTGSTLPDGQVWVGNGDNLAEAVALSGDVTITDAGVVTVVSVSGRPAASLAPLASPNFSGHLRYNGTSPTLSACGTSPSIDANATDNAGTVTVGSVATGCVITFATSYTSFNHCRVSSQSAISGLAYSYTKTAITISASVLGGDLVDYNCDGA